MENDYSAFLYVYPLNTVKPGNAKAKYGFGRTCDSNLSLITEHDLAIISLSKHVNFMMSFFGSLMSLIFLKKVYVIKIHLLHKVHDKLTD